MECDERNDEYLIKFSEAELIEHDEQVRLDEIEEFKMYMNENQGIEFVVDVWISNHDDMCNFDEIIDLYISARKITRSIRKDNLELIKLIAKKIQEKDGKSYIPEQYNEEQVKAYKLGLHEKQHEVIDILYDVVRQL